MRTQWHTVDTMERVLNLNDARTVNVKVTIQVTDDHEEVEGSFDFGDDAENAAYLERFNSGDLVSVCIRVKAEYDTAEGTDYLGGCHIKVGPGFDDDILDMVNDHGMIDEALASLKREIERIIVAFMIHGRV